MNDPLVISYVIRMELNKDGIGMRCYPTMKDVPPVGDDDHDSIAEIERRFPWHVSNVIGIMSSVKILVNEPQHVADFLKQQAEAGNYEASRTVMDMVVAQIKAKMTGVKMEMGELEQEVDLAKVIEAIAKGDVK